MNAPGVTLTLSCTNAVTEALAVEAALIRLRMVTTDEALIRRVIDEATETAYSSASSQSKVSTLIEQAVQRIATGDLR